MPTLSKISSSTDILTISFSIKEVWEGEYVTVLCEELGVSGYGSTVEKARKMLEIEIRELLKNAAKL